MMIEINDDILHLSRIETVHILYYTTGPYSIRA